MHEAKNVETVENNIIPLNPPLEKGEMHSPPFLKGEIFDIFDQL